MDCEEFLDDYSDFLDWQLEEHTISDYRGHIELCPDCSEYDRVMRQGLYLVRDLDPPETDTDIVPALEHRVFTLQDRLRQRASDYRRAAALAGLAAAGLLAVAVLPAVRPGGSGVELPPVVVEATADPGARTSVWGPAPRFGGSASLLRVPSLSSEPVLATASERISRFRAPLRDSSTPAVPDEVAPQ
jgi:hypothetical protein